MLPGVLPCQGRLPPGGCFRTGGFARHLNDLGPGYALSQKASGIRIESHIEDLGNLGEMSCRMRSGRQNQAEETSLPQLGLVV